MKNENMDGMKRKIGVYLVSIALGFIITFIFMLLFAVLSVTLDLAESFATPFASLSVALGSLFSAFLSSKRLKKGGLVNGIICGSAIFLISAVIALGVDAGSMTLNTLFNFLIIMLSSLIGGVWGVNQPTKKII